ncbi:hypothetical protein KFE98_14710 [bacterium SCSIO 12741]|nr:hypothetical protein KFE98_14710 [bacterium SCSIO 12741]
MEKNRFIEKFESKSDHELEQIIANPANWHEQARSAAYYLLKERNPESPEIQSWENEHTKLLEKEEQKIEEERLIRERIVTRLKSIPLKSSQKYILDYGNELQVKRLGNNRFQARIEDHYRSFLAPVVIYEIKGPDSYLYYPFFYEKPFFTWGVGGTLIILGLMLVGWMEVIIPMIFFPLGFLVFTQLMGMIVLPFLIHRRVEEKIGKKGRLPYRKRFDKKQKHTP